MTFQLMAQVGASGIETGDDLAFALRRVADQISDNYGSQKLAQEDRGNVWDLSGKTVGTWRFVQDTHQR